MTNDDNINNDAHWTSPPGWLRTSGNLCTSPTLPHADVTPTRGGSLRMPLYPDSQYYCQDKPMEGESRWES